MDKPTTRDITQQDKGMKPWVSIKKIVLLGEGADLKGRHTSIITSKSCSFTTFSTLAVDSLPRTVCN